jgi:hypothetical protein
MICNLANIKYVCDDIPTGGMVKLFIAQRSKTHPVFDINGNVTSISFDYFNRPVRIMFDYKDGYSNFSETVEVDGHKVNKPSIKVEIPLLNSSHRNLLDSLVGYRDDIVAFIESAAGTYHMVGYKRGLNATQIKAMTGSGLSDKNIYQIEFTGEEKQMSYDVTNVWEFIDQTNFPDYNIDYNTDFNK